MTDRDYDRLSEWSNEGTGALLPFNDVAKNLTDICRRGEILTFLELTDRDIKFHRCYMSLVVYIYDQLPNRFHKKLRRKNFYKYLKHLKGQFDIITRFDDGTVLVEYESISFAKMSQKQFENYIREQLPWIYVKVIGKYYKVNGWRYNRKIESIEYEYEKFLSKV
jgi:hypothetical protein